MQGAPRPKLTFQNENLCASVDGKILATAPDLICLVDTETFIPVTTDGAQVRQARAGGGPEVLSTCGARAKGLELVGPRYFGIDTDYIPVEERVKGGAANV